MADSKSPLFMPVIYSASRRGLNLVLYSATAFLFWFALYLYVPSLPLYAATKSAGLRFIGLALAQYGLWQALLTAFASLIVA
jgi:hypothetical protein